MDSVERRKKINKELIDLRVQGYVRLGNPRLKSVDTQLLEKAATRVPGYNDTLSRVKRVELVLVYAVKLVQEPYRSQLAVLFGLRDGLPEEHPLRDKLDSSKPTEMRVFASKMAGSSTVENYRKNQESDAIAALAEQISHSLLEVSNGAIADVFSSPDSDLPGGEIAAPRAAAMTEGERYRADPLVELSERNTLAAAVDTVTTHRTAKTPRTVGKRTAVAAIAGAAVLSVGVTVAVQQLGNESGSDGASATPSMGAAPVAAPSAAPPVRVQSVTQFQPVKQDHRYVLPERLVMSPQQLADFNAKIGVSSTAFSSWYSDHHGTVLDGGFTNLTLRGNTDESVRITDMQVLKDCRTPFDGTFLQGYTQGGGEETVQVGFNLDSPQPVAQQMAMTAAEGLHPAGGNFFSSRTITISRGDTTTISVGAFTKRASCAFKFRLIVATSKGALYQDIDNDGRPFEVTAAAAPVKAGFPASGYRALYAQDEKLNWNALDPATYQPR